RRYLFTGAEIYFSSSDDDGSDDDVIIGGLKRRGRRDDKRSFGKDVSVVILVKPVSLVSELLPAHIPQILINRERLPH
ncbi:unnamed protein product, partial [Adineta steineri]